MSEEFVSAFQFLQNHEIFHGRFLSCLDIEIAKVNPDTGEVDDNRELNTKREIWMECGPYDEHAVWHDIDLDCGGDCLEDAFIALAELVRKKYGEKEFDC